MSLNVKYILILFFLILFYEGNTLAGDDTLHVDYPGGEVQIGDIFSCYVTLKVGDSTLTELAEKITWSFNENGGNHDSTLLSKTGAQVRFEPTEAPSSVIIWGIYYDEGYGLYVSVYITVDVITGPADHVVIEESYKLEDSDPNDDNPLDSIFIAEKETFNDKFYAILRDKYGNWVGPADSARWSSGDDSIATAQQGQSPELGQGKAIRVTYKLISSTAITATSTQGFKDDITLVISSLQHASLSAHPGDTTYSTLSLDITLTSEAGNTIHYTIDGSDPDTSNKSQLYTGPVTISDDFIVLKAIAWGPDYLPTSGSWTYIRILPPATLIADPEDTTYTTYSLDITLYTNADRIYYTTDGSEPDTNNASQLYNGPVTIYDDTITLKAIAVGIAYIPTSDSWTYIRILPPASLTANPGDTIYRTTSLDIILTTNADRIYYTTDGSEPDTNDASQLYSGPITIAEDSITLKAIAVGIAYIPTSDSWIYVRILPATLSADPGDGTQFGLTLDVDLYTNADRIYYTIDGSPPDINNSEQLYTGTITIPESSPDTVTISAIAVGEYFSQKSGSWTYYRKYLPEITAMPAGMEFVDSVEVQLLIDYPGAKIYYTLDGSEPDSNSGTLYTGPIKITETTMLKARAFAPDVVPSPVLLEVYTRIFVVKSSFYRDTDGDGRIDMAELIFDQPPDSLPTAVVLKSPFDNSDDAKDTVYSSGISWLNGDASTLTVNITLNTPFKEDQNTGFEAGFYGSIIEGLYKDEAFQISDGVAPVINTATYCPGEIINVKTLDRAHDTLIVYFSEDVEDINFVEPFVFKTGDGIEYSFEMEQMSHSGDTAVFKVIKDADIEYPFKEDSIKIYYKAGISDTRGNDQDIKDNRYVKLQLKQKPYELVIKVLSPVDPATYTIPEVLRENTARGTINIKTGVVIVIDFLTNLELEDDTKINALECNVSIFDQVGNLVEQCQSIENGTDHLQIGILGNSSVMGKFSTKIVICWSGQNQNGRQVGKGMYMTEIHLLDHNNELITIHRLIGVQK